MSKLSHQMHANPKLVIVIIIIIIICIVVAIIILFICIISFYLHMWVCSVQFCCQALNELCIITMTSWYPIIIILCSVYPLPLLV